MRTVDYENLGKLNAPLFDKYRASFEKTLTSGWYVLGANVKTFETAFAAWVGSVHCIGLNSGLDALSIPLIAKKFKPGSEVIVPSNTYIATIIAVLQAGLKPVLAEPCIDSYNIDPKEIEKKISPRTVAIMPVHLYGRCCDMDEIMELAKIHNLYVIEDCAQAHGSSYKGKQAGTFGIGSFSFYPTKNLGALGDAGAITTADGEWAEIMRSIRNYGSKVKYYNEHVGMNSRLDEMQAGFLLQKLEILKDINAHKNTLAEIYQSDLSDNFIKPLSHPDYYHTYHIYNIRHPERNRLREHLLAHNIKTEIHYPLAPVKQEAMKGIIDEQVCPIAEEIHNTTLSLPISYAHSTDDVKYVVDVMNQFK